MSVPRRHGAVASGDPVAVIDGAQVESPPTRGLPDRVLLGRVVGFYEATLRESPEALGCLTERGIGPAEVIDRFRLGHGNRTLGYRRAGKLLDVLSRIEGEMSGARRLTAGAFERAMAEAYELIGREESA